MSDEHTAESRVDAIRDDIHAMKHSVVALGLELPGPVWDDVRSKWNAVAEGSRYLLERLEQVEASERRLREHLEPLAKCRMQWHAGWEFIRAGYPASCWGRRAFVLAHPAYPPQVEPICEGCKAAAALDEAIGRAAARLGMEDA